MPPKVWFLIMTKNRPKSLARVLRDIQLSSVYVPERLVITYAGQSPVVPQGCKVFPQAPIGPDGIFMGAVRREACERALQCGAVLDDIFIVHDDDSVPAGYSHETIIGPALYERIVNYAVLPWVGACASQTGLYWTFESSKRRTSSSPWLPMVYPSNIICMRASNSQWYDPRCPIFDDIDLGLSLWEHGLAVITAKDVRHRQLNQRADMSLEGGINRKEMQSKMAAQAKFFLEKHAATVLRCQVKPGKVSLSTIYDTVAMSEAFLKRWPAGVGYKDARFDLGGKDGSLPTV